MKRAELSKGRAFTMCFWAIIFIFCVMCAIGVVSKDLDLIPVAACLTALCSITGGYIGFQVANNGVKGAWWNNDMATFERENGGGDSA
jgi:hypothetical protein